MKKTKNILALSLIIILIFCFTGCSNTEKVKEKLCGPWGYEVESIDGKCYQFYIFSSDDTYQSIWSNKNKPSKNSEGTGTYEIEGSQIILTDEEGNIRTYIEYTFENDVLKLTDKNSDNSGNNELIYVEE